MKKVGIITLFHGSLNYGGVLQACALSKALDHLGIPNEQIRCVFDVEEEEQRTVLGTLKKLMNPRTVWNRIQYDRNARKAEQNRAGRREAFAAFNARYVPGSDRVYSTADIQECLGNYDAFVTGSDQVWNPEWYCRTLFLDFVPSDRAKISYAASLGKGSLTERQQQRIRDHLKDFRAVSVRETNAVELIAPLSPVPVACTLDPTLLLTGEQWQQICAEKMTQEKYIFCYFLGSDQEAAAAIQEYADQKHCRIAGIPYIIADHSEKSTISYDLVYPDASPAEFLSLIRNAEAVFTDSFHATVFSNLFEKEHFVFPRSGHSAMGSRIHRVTEIFGTTERFCDTPQKRTMEYLTKLPPIGKTVRQADLEQLRNASMEYLYRNLKQK